VRYLKNGTRKSSDNKAGSRSHKPARAEIKASGEIQLLFSESTVAAIWISVPKEMKTARTDDNLKKLNKQDGSIRPRQ
jgi:hypothetical protein